MSGIYAGRPSCVPLFGIAVSLDDDKCLGTRMIVVEVSTFPRLYDIVTDLSSFPGVSLLAR
jgi:hypothetical protein